LCKIQLRLVLRCL
nr:immunoglobulin heavy chain junction region [Mus musculus]